LKRDERDVRKSVRERRGMREEKYNKKDENDERGLRKMIGWVKNKGYIGKGKKGEMRGVR
jgi:hypothetical protein